MSKAISTEAATVAIRCIDSWISATKDSADITELAPFFDARRELSAFVESGDDLTPKKAAKKGGRGRTALGKSIDAGDEATTR